MPLKIVIRTKRFLRKPKIEKFTGAWKDEDEVRRVLTRFHPKAELLSCITISKS